jgi:hypothetical protein
VASVATPTTSLSTIGVASSQSAPIVELLALVDDTVMDDVVGGVVDEVVGTEEADDDPSVDVATTVLDVSCCESEQLTATIARAVSPSHIERNPTRRDCPNWVGIASTERQFGAARN